MRVTEPSSGWIFRVRLEAGTANVPLPAFTARPGDPRQWGTQFTLRR
jgi:hypothetical protein